VESRSVSVKLLGKYKQTKPLYKHIFNIKMNAKTLSYSKGPLEVSA